MKSVAFIAILALDSDFRVQAESRNLKHVAFFIFWESRPESRSLGFNKKCCLYDHSGCRVGFCSLDKNAIIFFRNHVY